MDTLPVKSQSALPSPWSVRQLDYPRLSDLLHPLRCFFSPVASEKGEIYADGGSVSKPGVWRLTTSGEKISCSFFATDLAAETSLYGNPCLSVGNHFVVFGDLGSKGLGDTLFILNICKDLSSLSGTR
jgi:hypothetical protein